MARTTKKRKGQKCPLIPQMEMYSSIAPINSMQRTKLDLIMLGNIESKNYKYFRHHYPEAIE